MTPAVSNLTDLIRKTYCHLSDEHLAWDQWALDWQEHSRTKPNIPYTASIWAMSKGFADALQKTASESKTNFFSKSAQRAFFRERLSNLALLCIQEPKSDNDENYLRLSDDQEIIQAISSLHQEILIYFK